jgi:hypothetical protein
MRCPRSRRILQQTPRGSDRGDHMSIEENKALYRRGSRRS